MNTFLKRNRMIKLFTVGWIFLMAVIATFLLLRAPSIDDRNVETIFISGENVYLYHQDHDGGMIFISIDGYDMNYAVIISGNSSESAGENTNTDISDQDMVSGWLL